MTRSPLVLLPSPLLGPAVWVPVARVLQDRGWTAVLPEALTAAPDKPEDVLRWWSELLLDGSVLVVHSNAGLYVPTLVARHDVRGVVFVDAGYPEPGARSVPMAPPVFFEFLRGLADDAGLLPTWTQWWPETDSLFPTRRPGRPWLPSSSACRWGTSLRSSMSRSAGRWGSRSATSRSGTRTTASAKTPSGAVGRRA